MRMDYLKHACCIRIHWVKNVVQNLYGVKKTLDEIYGGVLR